MKVNSNLIQKTRIIKRMTKDDLCKATGIAMAIISKVESGVDVRKVRPKTLGKIADALELRMEQLIVDEDLAVRRGGGLNGYTPRQR